MGSHRFRKAYSLLLLAMKIRYLLYPAISLLLICFHRTAQLSAAVPIQSGQNIIQSVVPFLRIVPDARSGAVRNAEEDNNIINSLGYLPLQIGNYWKANDKNFIKVIGKRAIQGKEFGSALKIPKA